MKAVLENQLTMESVLLNCHYLCTFEVLSFFIIVSRKRSLGLRTHLGELRIEMEQTAAASKFF